MSRVRGVPRQYRKFSWRQALIGLVLAAIGFIVAILFTMSHARH